MTYYLTRESEAHKWTVSEELPEGHLAHSETYPNVYVARYYCTKLNKEIPDAIDGRGRPSLPEDQKAKRVFFTLRPEVWQAISPEGDAKELKTFAKEAINEKLKREDKK